MLRAGKRPDVIHCHDWQTGLLPDRDHSRRPPAERTGYVFHHTDNQAVESALGRALRLWSARPREFGQLAANGMRADYSWAWAGQEYLDIYQLIRHK